MGRITGGGREEGCGGCGPSLGGGGKLASGSFLLPSSLCTKDTYFVCFVAQSYGCCVMKGTLYQSNRYGTKHYCTAVIQNVGCKPSRAWASTLTPTDVCKESCATCLQTHINHQTAMGYGVVCNTRTCFDNHCWTSEKMNQPWSPVSA